jgi:glycyl-tRNA synthetase beta chain
MGNHVLIEVGIEELPARFIDDAEEQLKTKTLHWLHEKRITYEMIQTYATPRRLAILIEEIATEQLTKTEEVRGPQLSIAKDVQGNWTRAAIGFTKGQGKTLDDLYAKVVKGNEYIFVEKTFAGQATKEILPELKQIIESIHFPQTMRWGSGSLRYARPIRWLVALYNTEIIPIKIAGVQSGNFTYGHRFLGDKAVISDPLQYESILETQFVIADSKKRETAILAGIRQLEEKEGFHVPIDEHLLQEVRNLVEYPTVFYGAFEEEYLQLPKEVLITSMKEHQRYFPIMDKKETLLMPYFIGVRNGDDRKIDNVRKGNEKVLRARLADAAFFFAEDKKGSIDFFMNKLKTVIFQEKIGTMYEKTEHVKNITTTLGTALSMPSDVKQIATRAAVICKFDLMTNMVNEFTELQGVMGEQYATYFGEEQGVAQAIREHYLPFQAHGKLPETEAGAMVSVAEKLATIVGSFSVGLIPSGSQDPHGLRRQAIGILRIIAAQKWHVPFEEIVQMATSHYHLDEEQHRALKQFFVDRATYILSEEHVEHDVSQAVFANRIGVFSYAMSKAQLLSKRRNDDEFKYHQEALVRIMKLAKETEEENLINETLFQTDSEQKLFNEFTLVKTAFEKEDENKDSKQALGELMRLSKPIHAFFDNNMVLAKDEEVRNNRLALVNQITHLILGFANLTLIEWKQHL